MPGSGKKPLSIFEFPLKTWEEFVAIKLLADLAEILQVEDLLHCTFHPLRNLARATMPEERFHAQFGEDFSAELIKTPEGKARLQAAVNEYCPYLPMFSGRPRSRNNAIGCCVEVIRPSKPRPAYAKAIASDTTRERSATDS